MNNIAEISNLSFAYDNDIVLDNVSFTIDEKDFIGIIGPNGGGKTTLIKLLLGLLQPLSGKINIFNSQPELVRERIGYVPQYLSYDRNFPISCIELVLMGLFKTGSFFSHTSDYNLAKAEKAMELLRIKELANRQFNELSGGQKQRCLIARAIINSPQLLILDEPTSSVDISVEQDIFELLHELNKDITILLISHDIGFISNYVNKIFCINRTLSQSNSGDLKDISHFHYFNNISQITHKCGL